MNMTKIRPMPTAEEIKDMYPLSEEMKAAKKKNDEAVKKILLGESDKLLLIIGPCSADREDAVLEYINKLRKVQDKVADKIVIVPRIYTNKPRTTGDGYKGMAHQPDPSSKPDMVKGLIAIRKLHIDAISQTGFSCADEMLYPENHSYLSDCLTYVAVGARSVENQLHRLTASGLDIPVGMKNPTGGELNVMLNSIQAAQHPHTFVYGGYEVETTGNVYAHAILRGYTNKHGESMPNYHYEDILLLNQLYQERGLENPGVIVDTNHANSGKRFDEQPRIAKEILHSSRHSEEIHKLVKGLMVESYLLDGNQKPGGGVYGQSITDACLGWEKTERMVLELAEIW